MRQNTAPPLEPERRQQLTFPLAAGMFDNDKMKGIRNWFGEEVKNYLYSNGLETEQSF